MDIDLWAENQKGELVLKGHASGQIYYNAEDEARQKRGDGPLVVDVSEQTELPRNAKGKPVKPKVAAPVRPPEKPVALPPAAKKPAPKAPPPKSKPAAKPAARK